MSIKPPTLPDPVMSEIDFAAMDQDTYEAAVTVMVESFLYRRTTDRAKACVLYWLFSCVRADKGLPGPVPSTLVSDDAIDAIAECLRKLSAVHDRHMANRFGESN